VLTAVTAPHADHIGLPGLRFTLLKHLLDAKFLQDRRHEIENARARPRRDYKDVVSQAGGDGAAQIRRVIAGDSQIGSLRIGRTEPMPTAWARLLFRIWPEPGKKTMARLTRSGG